jgi:hypothetical protein
VGALSLEAVSVLTALRDDFEAFCELCVRIRALADDEDDDAPTRKGKPKRWRIIPLRLNDEQRAVVETILRDEAEGRGSRIIVLKARKLGISTVVQALAFWLGCFRPGWQSVTIAHIAPSTRVIGRMGVDMAKHLPDLFVPFMGATPREGGIVWANGSSMSVQTQRSDHAARGSSPSLLHMSEVGLWDHGRRASTAEESIAATLDALETDGEHAALGTIAIIESTANGQQGSFYERWQRASSGESGWTPLFFPWQTAAKHVYPLRAGDAEMVAAIAASSNPVEAWKSSGVFVTSSGKFDPEAADLFAPRAHEYGLTPPQVRWYVTKWNEKNRDITIVDQEFPLSPAHAFAASGRPVLPSSVVDAIAEPEVPTPIWAGCLPLQTPGDKRLHAERWRTAIANPGRYWRIYSEPVPSWRERYVVGCDVAGGGGPDASAIQVLDRVTRRVVAEFHGEDVTPDDLGVQLDAIGRLYGGELGPAMVVPESNNHGVATIRKLLDLGYPRIYTRSHPTMHAGARPDAWTSIYGHETNQSTRPVLMSSWRAALVQGTMVLHSPRIQAECRTLVYDEQGRMDHTPGKRSDLIIASALALAGDRVLSAPVEITVVRHDPNNIDYRESLHRPERTNRWFGSR